MNRLLLIDSYDSFTYNLAALIHRIIPCSVIHIIRNDDFTMQELLPHLLSFSAVIVGPGPGSPKNPHDVGLISDLWNLPDEHLLPVFGVCLGLQSMCLQYGGEVLPLKVVKHGQISQIFHNGIDLFNDLDDHILGVRYHSLHVRLTEQSADIQELAWADDGEENGRVLMAARHRQKPFWAVQYHPESVCTTGDRVVSNFWKVAQSWITTRNRKVQPLRDWKSRCHIFPPISQQLPQMINGHSIPSPRQLNFITLMTTCSTLNICEKLGASHPESEFVALESVTKPGRFSVLGLVDSYATKITYSAAERYVHISRQCDQTDCNFPLEDGLDIWHWLSAYMRTRRVIGGAEEIPFWAGLIGYLSYELGVASIQVSNRHSKQKKHDLNLAFVERSVVIDNLTGKVYLQSLIPEDSWIDSVRVLIENPSLNSANTYEPSYPSSHKEIEVTLPCKEQYISKIRSAQAFLAEGQSYELCVTALTKVRLVSSNVESASAPWEIYRCLRQFNPAPHAAYIRLSGVSLVGSSPERFLSWSRSGFCQLRPIKGTVRKSPGMTRERATELLHTPKELAENLMIVDLIRHDLHQVAGGSVAVTQLMGVEEYETVYHLVSVIEGQITMGSDISGGDVLGTSLPPGSMTGAPKKRSVELLQTLENEERGVYSGVCGYWCAGGGGDWSVVIRSSFRYDEECSVIQDGRSEDRWYIGAGGAITALSNPEEEWDEMETKLKSTLRALELYAGRE